MKMLFLYKSKFPFKSGISPCFVIYILTQNICILCLQSAWPSLGAGDGAVSLLSWNFIVVKRDGFFKMSK